VTTYLLGVVTPFIITAAWFMSKILWRDNIGLWRCAECGIDTEFHFIPANPAYDIGLRISKRKHVHFIAAIRGEGAE
jgi:hypothetical protein